MTHVLFLGMSLPSFNVRVYGLCFNRMGEVLLSDERRSGNLMTKFPGGGLEFGEGLSDCLKREFMEELQLDIEVGKLFYINDFFQRSAFRTQNQILSVYYLVEVLEASHIPLGRFQFDFENGAEDAQAFRWMEPELMSESDLTFPIDKTVLGILQAGIHTNLRDEIAVLIKNSVFP